jgi:hypothetical protein
VTVSSVDRAVAEVQRRGWASVVVSRTAGPTLQRALTAVVQVVEAPAVAGRTVWAASADGDGIVAETPNWWGYRDTPEVPTAIVVRHRVEPSAVRAARHLAKAVEQLPGLTVPYGPPDAPWFVCVQPQPPARVVARLGPLPDVDIAALGPTRPELPGGLRIALGTGAAVDAGRVVDSLRHVLGHPEGP